MRARIYVASAFLFASIPCSAFATPTLQDGGRDQSAAQSHTPSPPRLHNLTPLEEQAADGAEDFADNWHVAGRSFGVQASGDEVWGLGPAYKVRFEDGAFEFTPALGREAPRNFPLSYRLDSIWRGGELVHRAEGPASALATEGEVRFERGDSIVERYDVRAEGIEQCFVFDSIPPGSGDLVVRGTLTTDLAPAGLDGDGGLRFAAAGWGGVRYGGVTGIDGAGRTARGTVTLDGDRLALSLPAEFVAAAVPPLVLDPLIEPVIDVATSGYDDADPDVAYDATNDVYLVVWERAFSETDSDIRGQRVSSAGSKVGSLILVEPSPDEFADNPAVGGCNDTDQFFVAWESAPVSHVTPGISGRSVAAADGTLSAILILAPYTSGGRTPDVGGEATTADDDVIVVFEAAGFGGDGIRAQQVSVPSEGDPFLVGSKAILTNDEDDGRPCISNSGGASGRLLVAWQRWFDSPAPGDHDVFAVVIDRNANVLSSVHHVASGVGPDESLPDCDGDGTSWVVAYERDEDYWADEPTIHAARLAFDGIGLTTEAGPILASELLSGAPSVGYTGEAYVVSCIRSYGPTTYRVGVTSIDPLSCGACDLVEITGYNHDCRNAAVATQYSGSVTAGDGALVVWEAEDLSTADLDVLGQLYRSETGIVDDLGGACGQGGEAFATCARYSNHDFTHRLSCPMGFVPAFLVIGLKRADISCGSCVLVPDPFTGFVVSAGLTSGMGEAEVAMPIPHDVDVIGVTFIDQWAIVDGSPSCTQLGVDLSNAIQVTIE